MKDSNMTPLGSRHGSWLTETGIGAISTKNGPIKKTLSLDDVSRNVYNDT